MNEISEERLKEILNTYNDKPVNVKIEGVIGAEFTINKLKYHYKNGNLCLSDEVMDTALEINITFVYMIFMNEDGARLEIKLDNDENVIIEL